MSGLMRPATCWRTCGGSGWACEGLAQEALRGAEVVGVSAGEGDRARGAAGRGGSISNSEAPPPPVHKQPSLLSYQCGACAALHPHSLAVNSSLCPLLHSPVRPRSRPSYPTHHVLLPERKAKGRQT